MKAINGLVAGILLLAIIFTSGCKKTVAVSAPILTPLSPSNLVANVVSTSQVNLQWQDNSKDEIGFKIERKTGAGNFSVIGETQINGTIYSDKGLTPQTSYTYRVYSFNSTGQSKTYSNEATVTTTLLPTITTADISDTTSSTAVCGGNIISDGASPDTARGVVWSTQMNPTISLSTKTEDRVGIGSFTSQLTGLSATTTYYVRAYATNIYGTAYGAQVSFTTRTTISDGSVTIGTQIWDLKNIDISTYRNGDSIPQITDKIAWDTCITGAWCYYDNDPANGPIYGKLYNWYAVNDPRGLAPEGWHIPSYSEWQVLMNYEGGYYVAGGALKEAGGEHWSTPNTGTNSSGFSARGGGERQQGTFAFINWNAAFWSSDNPPYLFQLNYADNLIPYSTASRSNGLSVRVVKN